VQKDVSEKRNWLRKRQRDWHAQAMQREIEKLGRLALDGKKMNENELIEQAMATDTDRTKLLEAVTQWIAVINQLTADKPSGVTPDSVKPQ